MVVMYIHTIYIYIYIAAYIYLYFARVDQRVQQFYNYHNASCM